MAKHTLKILWCEQRMKGLSKNVFTINRYNVIRQSLLAIILQKLRTNDDESCFGTKYNDTVFVDAQV